MAHLVEVLHFLLNVGDGEALRRAAGEVVLQQRAHVVQLEVGLVEERHLVDHLRDGALQLADVRAGAFRDVHLDVVGDVEVVRPFRLAVLVHEAFHDAQLRLDLGGLDVERAARVEAAAVALVDVDVLRRAVGRQHHLAALAGQLVEYLEHDVERLLLALQVLDVVDEQHVGFLVARLEVLVAGFLLVVRRAGLHVVAQQLGRVHVDGGKLRHRLVDVVLDGAHEVRFPQTRLAVDEQRVEVRLARHLGHGHGHGVRHAVRIADDEVLERKRGRGAVGAVERYFSFRADAGDLFPYRPSMRFGTACVDLRRTCGIRGRSRRGLRRADRRRRFCRRRHGCRRGCLRGGRSRRRSGRFGGCDVHFDDHGERHVVQVVQRAFDELDIMTLDPCLYKVVVRGDHEEPVAHSLRMQA